MSQPKDGGSIFKQQGKLQIPLFGTQSTLTLDITINPHTITPFFFFFYLLYYTGTPPDRDNGRDPYYPHPNPVVNVCNAGLQTGVYSACLRVFVAPGARKTVCSIAKTTTHFPPE